MGIEAYFDRLASRWNQMPRPDSGFLEHLAAETGLTSGQKVLDAGTGTGVMLPYLARRVSPARIWALDISREMIRKARCNYPYLPVRYLQAHLERIPLPSSSLDAVMCFSVFPHVNDKAASVGEIARVLKRGGTLVIAHADSRDAINRRHRDIGGPVRDHSLPPDRDMEHLVKSAGLKLSYISDKSASYVLKADKT